MKKGIIVFCATLILFSSCIGIETTVTIDDENGSGTIALTYRVSNKIAHLGRLDPEESIIPLPVERQDYEQLVEAQDGLSLRNYTQREETEDTYITATLDFTSIESLNGILKTNTEAPPLVIERTEEATQLQYTIFTRYEQPLDEETINMIETFFSDYSLAFTFRLPSTVQTSNFGSIADDERTVTYSIDIPTLFRENETKTLQIVW